MTHSRIALVLSVAAGSFVAGLGHLPPAMAQAALGGVDVSQQPLFTMSGQTPLMMMVMSRDEQLYNKAYSDYSNLHRGEAGDTGQLNFTYDDTFDYSGYFGSNLCYTYASNVFTASAAATGTNRHSCSGQWSGNFLNWVTMSRIDVVRHVLYGGLRSTDTATATVLERSHIPNDLHAWVKIYDGSDINLFTPYSVPTTFCNASFNGDANPYMRVGTGRWTEWASVAAAQCIWGQGGPGTGTDFVVRTNVCGSNNAALREPFCRPYTQSNGTVTWKPAGLLQEYGETGKIRFGLMTGSYANPRSGGRLRRNIGDLAGNTAGALNAEGCRPGDEINLQTGRFCNQGGTGEGIIKTLNQLRLVGWDGSGWRGVAGAAHGDNCWDWGGRARNDPYDRWNLDNPGGGDRHCSAWGNPLSELYAEAVRYIKGNGNAPTAGFVSGNDTVYLPGISDMITWRDPYGSPSVNRGLGNPYCANCSILVLSTGLNTFDSDEIPSAGLGGINARTATDEVGSHEGINGGNYLIGRVLGQNGSPTALAIGANVDTASDICTSKTLNALGNAIGLCPDLPSAEGSFNVAGLAFKAWTTDLRPDLVTSPVLPKPATHRNQVKTFSVSLAENLPNFAIPVGGRTINFTPLCQSHSDGTAGHATVGWASCRLGASILAGVKSATVNPQYTYGRALDYTAAVNGYTAGSYHFVWEDSTYGSDNDLDVTQVVTWCVGAACNYQSPQTLAGTRLETNGTVYNGYDICWRAPKNLAAVCGTDGRPAVGADEVLIRSEITSTAGGYAMASGYNINGTSSDGPQRTDLATRCAGGGAANGTGGMGNFSVLGGQANPPACWTVPDVKKFSTGDSAARRLENPLWYAAKYGGFKDGNSNNLPDAGEWDSIQTGTPDNYFAVTNPSKLKAQLARVFDTVVGDARPAASVATSTPRYVPGSTLAYEASYNSDNWSGDLKAFRLAPDGTYNSEGQPEWAASEEIPSAAARNTFTARRTGSTWTGIPFSSTGLDAVDKATLQAGLDPALYPTDDLIAFLKGEQSKEQGSAGCVTATDCPFRKRGSAFGDILNSTPAVMGVTSLGYGSILSSVAPTAASSYTAFVQSKRAVYGNNSENPIIYVGANDGMLHAINGGADANGGSELFSYVPNGVFGKLHMLAEPSYVHQYFVDGTPTVGDAYLGSTWRTVLTGSLNAGGKGVYTLDITDPRNFNTSHVMWEFNSDDDADMGQFVGRPYMGLTESGTWVAAFGNGLNSASGRAILFIRDLATGAPIAKLDTGAGCLSTAPNCTDGPNGLATAVLVDNDGNGAADTVYAGDYLGNVWRFEYVSGAWLVGNGGQPIFIATDPGGKRQSITSGMYTVANPLGGTMIVFGTGRYLNTHDADPAYLGQGTRPSVDSIYGIWDSRMWDETNGAWTASWPIAQRTSGVYSTLHQQRITSYVAGSGGVGGWRTATRDPVDYKTSPGDTNGKMGWWIDINCAACGLAGGVADPLLGERVTATPQGILSDVLFNTFRPEGNTCLPGSQIAQMVFDALTGAASYTPIAPSDGWPAGEEPPLGVVGTDTGHGAPPGEPPIVVITPPGLGVPPLCPDDDPDCNRECDPADPDCDREPPVTKCSWRSPNPAGKPAGKLIPCGRISWKQMR